MEVAENLTYFYGMTAIVLGAFLIWLYSKSGKRWLESL